MATLASIKKQIADLEKKAEALIKAESKDAIAKVKSLIEKYQLTAVDLGFMTGGVSQADKPAKATRGGKRTAGKKKAGTASVGVAMYQDPKTGKTWTGRGKPPNWLAGVKDRSAFLINAAAAPAAEAPKKTAAPKKAAKTAKAGKAKVAKAAAVPEKAPAKATRATRKGAVKKAMARNDAAKSAKPVKKATRGAGKKSAAGKKAVNAVAMPVAADAGQATEASAS